jgi:hypothetical protein
MRAWLSVSALLLTVSGAAGFLGLRARAARVALELALQENRARPAPPPGIGDRISGSKLTRLPEDVCVEVGASLLPPVTTSEGNVLRAVWTNAVFTRYGITVGESQYHAMIPAESRASVDLSLSSVELSPDVPPRSYRVTIAPRSPKAWGTVASFDDDLVVETSADAR